MIFISLDLHPYSVIENILPSLAIFSAKKLIPTNFSKLMRMS